MSTTTTLPETPPAPAITDRRLLALSAVLVLGALASILDTTIVNVALDTLHGTFHASVADTQWVVTGYLLALAAVIPLTGWASERFGARTVWITAVAAFLAGSILCGFAWSLPSLIAFRVLQGIGGGMILPVTMSILTQAAGPGRIGRTMAYIALPAQLAPIFGPVIGGALIDSANWNWLFFVNIPLCVLALVLAPLVLPRDERRPAHPLDIRGFLLLAPGLVALVFGISEVGGTDGFASPSAWLPLALGAALVAGFAVYAARVRRRAPLLDVRLFAKRSFGLVSAITFVSGFSTYAAMLLLPLFYQVLRGESAATTGLLLIPQGLGTITFILLMNRLTTRIEPRTVAIAGILLTVLGGIPFALAGSSGGEVLLLVALFVRGVGMGASMIPIMAVAFESVPKQDVPRASAAFSIVQRVGAPFGTAVIAVILEGYLAHSSTDAAGITSAFGSTFWWVFAFSAAPLLLALFLPKRTPPAAPPA